MDARMAETKQMNDDLIRRKKYGNSGGPDGRGILTNLKAAELPDESLLDFSSTPFTFEESALLVAEDMEKLHYLAGTANRFSDKYLKCLPQLERYINKAGSLCLTRAVLEQKGFSFPKLENLNTLDLLEKVSFHILKCHAAIDGLYRDNDRLGFVYLQWELRWINLGERLKATETKIQRIKNGELKADALLQDEDGLRKQFDTKKKTKDAGKPRSYVNPSALPLLTSMAADMLRREQIIEKQQRDYQRAEDRAMRSLGINTIPPYPVPMKPASQPEETRNRQNGFGPKEIPEGMITEGEARRILIEEAISRGDHAAVLEIQKEDSDAFRERWERHLIETASPGKRAGPSDEVRKKLREKRKKKRKL